MLNVIKTTSRTYEPSHLLCKILGIILKCIQNNYTDDVFLSKFSLSSTCILTIWKNRVPEKDKWVEIYQTTFSDQQSLKVLCFSNNHWFSEMARNIAIYKRKFFYLSLR